MRESNLIYCEEGGVTYLYLPSLIAAIKECTIDEAIHMLDSGEIDVREIEILRRRGGDA